MVVCVCARVCARVCITVSFWGFVFLLCNVEKFKNFLTKFFKCVSLDSLCAFEERYVFINFMDGRPVVFIL